MKLLARTAALSVVLTIAASPAAAQGPAEGAPATGDTPGATQQQASMAEGRPKPDRGTARRLAAPGQYCRAASKTRVDGQKGTAFSACVRAQARLRKGTVTSPSKACKDASKKRVEGQKGTAFSACVKAGAQLLADRTSQAAGSEQS